MTKVTKIKVCAECKKSYFKQGIKRRVTTQGLFAPEHIFIGPFCSKLCADKATVKVK